jgi:hypothetical protein
LLLCSISAPGLSTKRCAPSAMNSSSCPSPPEDHRRPLSLSTRYLLRTLLDHHRRTTVPSNDSAGSTYRQVPELLEGIHFPRIPAAAWAPGCGTLALGLRLTAAGITATVGARRSRSGERCRRPYRSRVQPADRVIRASTELWTQPPRPRLAFVASQGAERGRERIASGPTRPDWHARGESVMACRNPSFAVTERDAGVCARSGRRPSALVYV